MSLSPTYHKTQEKMAARPYDGMSHLTVKKRQNLQTVLLECLQDVSDCTMHKFECFMVFTRSSSIEFVGMVQCIVYTLVFEPLREKMGFLPMRKQRRRSASQ